MSQYPSSSKGGDNPADSSKRSTQAGNTKLVPDAGYLALTGPGHRSEGGVSSARSEFAKAVGLDARLIHLLKSEEVEALVTKTSGEDLDKRLQLRFLYQSVLAEVPNVAAAQVDEVIMDVVLAFMIYVWSKVMLMILSTSNRITDDTVKYRQRLAQVKQKTNELIGISIANDELLDKFVRGLRPNYQKAVKTIYAHIRDTNELCSVLTLWEASNSESGATVNVVSTGEDSVNVEGSQVGQGPQSQGSAQVRVKVPIKCWYCNGAGHMKRDCDLWKAKQLSPSSVNVAPAVAVPATTKPIGNKSSDQDPANVATRGFEKVSVISAIEPRCSQWGAKVAALLDTGGQGTAYINADLYRAIKSVTFGNGERVAALGCFFASLEDGDKKELVKSVQFKVIEGLTPLVIVGIETIKRSTLLQSMLLASISSIAIDGATSDTIDVNDHIAVVQPDEVRAATNMTLDDHGYTVDCPVMSARSVMPYAEPRRRRSRSKEIAIHRRILIAAREGKFAPIDVASATVINEVVLVDKGSSSGDGSSVIPIYDMTDDEIKKRFRVTLDCRRLNCMRLVKKPDSPGEYMWVLPTEMAETWKLESSVTQSQTNAFLTLREWPGHLRRFYFKLDLSDAFSAVRTAKDLWPLFCCKTYDEFGQEHVWCCTVIVQGFRYSPILFSRVVSDVLEAARAECKRLGYDVKLTHFQDDILGGGSSLTVVSKVKELVERLFVERGFQVAPHKCQLGDEVVFCGLKCLRGEVRPSERKVLTTAIVNASCADFERITDVEEKKKWIRSWSGKFQWLSRLHKVSPDGNEAFSLVREIADYYFSGLACLYVFGHSDTFKLVAIPRWEMRSLGATAMGWMAELENVIPRVTDLLHISICGDEVLMLLPLCLDGGSLSNNDMKKSSTFRERKAQLMSLHRFLPLCMEPVIMVGDNMNSVGDRHWHSLETNHCADEYEMNMVMEYQRSVVGTLWVNRSSCISLVDAMARISKEEADTLECDRQDGLVVTLNPLSCMLATINDLDDESICVIDDDVESWNDIVVEPFVCPKFCDLDEVRRQQLTCPEVVALKGQSGFLSDPDGTVYRVQRFSPTGTLVKQLLLPKSCRRHLVEQAHADTHANGRQLKFFLQSWAWFPKLGNLCRAVAQACPTCQLTASQAGREFAPHGTRRPTSDTPTAWLRVGVDVVHMGGGGKLLTATCWYTSFCDFEPIPDTKASSFIRGLCILFMRCGWPRCVFSDGEFNSQEVQSWSKEVGISWTIHAANHPQSGGFYERRHRMIVEAMRKFTLASGSLWSDELILAQVKWLVNHSEIGESGICPALLFYGRVLPVPCMRGVDDDITIEQPQSLCDLLKIVGRVDSQRQKMLAMFLNEWLDQRERSRPTIRYESNLKPGVLVYVFTERVNKLSPTFRGPFPVLSVRGRHVLVTTSSGVEMHWLGNVKRFKTLEPDGRRQAAVASEERTQQALREENRVKDVLPVRSSKRLRGESPGLMETVERAKKVARS
ncbi:gag/pol/env polyprotein, putative [Perkinsus marinus ATCC 50983]|uniref:Gag/pol/env polyprotein, putative n=1 Tax=Perkinsus marinus (strain ATCC 50983 / TXsc) TaxID=423536 RepID=C5LCM0_PERM5|nr:gag/pol/env polyprotein, putative [Perkinsus marinus ATCC 50983]EER05703.1 gag/pol/env polyprotein, putative [Perkinsus marinus ATCC 50983]|eukprot:XP_002773887.1 gag/pol/env polyprotein, putative [Perkinsus marinus ATCC 50983]